MTRPEIIRADTIDLQDRGAPSAKHHPHGPSPKSTSHGSVAPHQAETIREVASETAEENLRSPRISWPSRSVGDLHQYAEDLIATEQNNLAAQQNARNAGNYTMAGSPQDSLAIAQNGGLSSQDNSEMESDADDGMDDDMMDKISSSPSIEDGGLPRASSSLSQTLWPRRVDSLKPMVSSLSIVSIGDTRSSSPYLEEPEFLPLVEVSPQRAPGSPAASPTRLDHHHVSPGKYDQQDRSISHDESNTTSPASTPSKSSPYRERTARMSVLQEVLAEMHRMEQENTVRQRSLDAIPEVEDSVEDSGRWLGGRTTEEEEGSKDTLTDIAGDDPADSDSDCSTIIYSGLTVPYEGSIDHDDDGDFSCVVEDDRFIDSGWGDDCLQDAEDIDFEFVYALHTFVATVEGQANATKGDTMVLLDDSNSYWWLVRVVKDSSIGYLPAEHIETPTERLARLNKHRNIDLSATMLGDQAEKTKNPIKSAIRRRKAKTVTFNSTHQYHDYSDFDYSSEEEDLDADLLVRTQQQGQQSGAQQIDADSEMEDETAKVEPLKPRSQQKDTALLGTESADVNGDSSRSQVRTSEEIFETKSGDGPKKTSDGTVRDSFFKDDTVETKKITLTPNLLRDDNAPRSSADSNKDLKQRSSLDKLEKDDPFTKDDKKKKEKKEKEKKPGAFRSLFSRKDKKKGSIDDDDSFGKRSMDADGQEKDAQADEPVSSPEKEKEKEKPTGPQRNPSKLRKQQPRTEPTLTSAGTQSKESGMDLASFLAGEGKPAAASMRVVKDPYEDLNSSPEASPQKASRDRSRPESPSTSRMVQQPPKASIFQRKNSDAQLSEPQPLTQAKLRAVLDDSDSDEEEDEDEAMVPAQAPVSAPAPARPAPVPEELQRQQSFRPHLPGAFPDSYISMQSAQSNASDVTERGIPVDLMPDHYLQQEPEQPELHPQEVEQHRERHERLSESPVQISPVNSNNPPPLIVDTSSQEEGHSSDRDTPSPELIEREDGDMHGHQDSSITTTTSAGAIPAWNDASLRAFFDSGSDIRDMLVVVYDKTDVVPAGPEHPVVGTLFKEQNAKLAEITTQLDNMLGDWLARKQRLRGSV